MSRPYYLYTLPFVGTKESNYPGITYPAPVWKLWDSSEVQESRMIGYWVSSNPVRTSDPDVPARVYLTKGRAMVALASWAIRS